MFKKSASSRSVYPAAKTWLIYFVTVFAPFPGDTQTSGFGSWPAHIVQRPLTVFASASFLFLSSDDRLGYKRACFAGQQQTAKLFFICIFLMLVVLALGSLLYSIVCFLGWCWSSDVPGRARRQTDKSTYVYLCTYVRTNKQCCASSRNPEMLLLILTAYERT